MTWASRAIQGDADGELGSLDALDEVQGHLEEKMFDLQILDGIWRIM